MADAIPLVRCACIHARPAALCAHDTGFARCACIHARPASLCAPDTGVVQCAGIHVRLATRHASFCAHHTGVVQCAGIHVRHEPFSRSERYGFPAAPPSHSHALRELYFAVLNYLRIFAA